MADTYTKLFIHTVFAVRGRENIISLRWKDDLYRYITGIVTNNDQKLMIINGMPDHIHLLLSIKPAIALSDLIRDIKANSSRFINEQRWVQGRFEWQHGFGAFTCNPAELDTIINYIKNQEEHHKMKSFKEEYVNLLNYNNIVYKTEYLFDDI
ncbi:MAG: IS200/IS605 family transposase [Bacteroidales bacterium]